MVADYWFMQVEKVLEAMEISSYTTRIRLAAFQLKGEAQVWWNWAKTSRDLEAMTWVEFHDLFMGKYFPDTARHAKAQEFLELKQGAMTVIEYVARFMELARFTEDYVAIDLAKVRRFENGLRLSIRGRIVGLRLQDTDSMVGTALTIEREIEDARSTRDAGVSRKRKEDPSSSNPRKKQKTSVSHGSQGHSQGHQDQGQDGKFSHAGQMMCYFYRQLEHFRRDCPRRKKSQSYGTPQSQSLVRRVRVSSQAGADGVLPLPTARTYEEGLPSETGIPGFRDSVVPITGGEDTVHSSTAQYRPEESVSVSGSCTGTSRYTGRLKRPSYGLRQRMRPTDRDVRGLGACLRHHTTG